MEVLATKMRKISKIRWKLWKKPVLLMVFSLMAGCLLMPDIASSDDQVSPKPAYRLGIFPYLPALTIDRLYGPLAESFSLTLDRLVKLRTKSTFENFASAIDEQSYDILFVHPFFFVDAVDRHGYLPLARLDRPLHAVLVAAENSDKHSLEDLEGQTIGLPPKLAAVSKLIKSALIEVGFRPGLDIGIRHFRNKASCLQAVSTGAVAACGVPAFILDQKNGVARQPLRTIFEAPPVNHFAFAIHNRVPEKERELLLNHILSLGGDNVKGFGSDQQFVQIEAADYMSIRTKTTSLETLAQR